MNQYGPRDTWATRILTLVVEPIDAIDRGALVVTAQKEEVLGILYLVGEEEADRLERLLPAVDVVAKKEVVGLGRKAPVLEQTQEIIVLPVRVSCGMVYGQYLALWVKCGVPHIFIGASSSSRMGCESMISRPVVHR